MKKSKKTLVGGILLGVGVFAIFGLPSAENKSSIIIGIIALIITGGILLAIGIKQNKSIEENTVEPKADTATYESTIHKSQLLSLQNILYPGYSTNKLVFSEDRLNELANEKAQKCLGSIQYSLNLCNYTNEPKQFFQSYDNLINQAEQLVKLEPYVHFINTPPSMSLNNVKLSEQAAIRRLLDRYCDRFIEENLTNHSKESEETVLDNFLNALSLYKSRMDQESSNYLNNECKDKIQRAYEKNQRDHCSPKHEDPPESTKIEKPLTMGDYSNVIQASLGITVDYSNDGFFLSNLKNAFFQKSNDGLQYNLIDNFIKYSSPERLKLVIIDDSFMLNKYCNIPHLLIPIVEDPQLSTTILHMALTKSTSRQKAFRDNRCKDINSYNQLALENIQYIIQRNQQNAPLTHINTATEIFPYIVVIINEVHTVLKDKDFLNTFVDVLLKTQNCGIFFFLFSKFSLKNLNLGLAGDLLNEETDQFIDSIFNSSIVPDGLLDGVNTDDMTGSEFEQFCGSLLQKDGFSNIVVTKSSSDYGADVTAVKDGIKYAIQCKKYNNPVGVSAVQEVIASKSIYNCHVAAVLTNNTFTKNAQELARKNNVLLWDNGKLKELLYKAHTFGI